MRHGVSQVEEEGVVFVFFDKGESLVSEQLRDACSFRLLESSLISFSDKLVGAGGLRPKGEIKSLVVRTEFESEGRRSSCSSACNVPFSSHAGFVSLFFEDFGEGDLIE